MSDSAMPTVVSSENSANGLACAASNGQTGGRCPLLPPTWFFPFFPVLSASRIFMAHPGLRFEFLKSFLF